MKFPWKIISTKRLEALEKRQDDWESFSKTVIKWGDHLVENLNKMQDRLDELEERQTTPSEFIKRRNFKDLFYDDYVNNRRTSETVTKLH